MALEALGGLATLQAKRGNLEHALELLLIALDHPASIRDTKDRANRLRTELEAQLTNGQREAAVAWAKANTFEAVVEEILKQV